MLVSRMMVWPPHEPIWHGLFMNLQPCIMHMYSYGHEFWLFQYYLLDVFKLHNFFALKLVKFHLKSSYVMIEMFSITYVTRKNLTIGFFWGEMWDGIHMIYCEDGTPKWNSILMELLIMIFLLQLNNVNYVMANSIWWINYQTYKINILPFC